MSRTTRSATPTRRRRRPVALLAAAATAFGLLAFASPVHADSVIQVSAPAGPVQAGTAYTVTVQLPNASPDQRNNAPQVDLNLSGAAATVTTATTSVWDWSCQINSGTAVSCWNLAALTTPTTITLTVLPTAGGTVAVHANALSLSSNVVGSDSGSTEVTAPVQTPALTGVSPYSGPETGGTSVTLTGTGFTDATAVHFGSAPASSFTVLSDTQITATAPAGTPGAVDVTVTTPAGTSATGTADRFTYTPVFPFAGFFAPVHNLPDVNSVNAGRSVPMKFSLGGDKGLGVLANGSPWSQRTDCGTGAVDTIETGAASVSGLTYDAASGTYTYVWNTDRSWAGTCRTFHLTLTDGTDHTAAFKFR
ncbi:PxKF domain-containing protein [Streptomyces diastatochromogenes]|nr:PxKF domain-containing protein [Streptomyces diastatochromogenes]